MQSGQGQYKVRSRSQRHQREKQKKETTPRSQAKTHQLALFLMVVAIIALFVGSMIGYGVLGKGNPLQVLNPGTWIHIIRLVFG
ncbi:DNA-directed RNA polymerase subunit beta [Tepidibacillus sp. LV47]|uniref:DNA-directed RNA polymerase subunit beta n=1 Tax=Tepidibacillus sp. LV47 TaxID=3398228 RepID=UPI003AAD6457